VKESNQRTYSRVVTMGQKTPNRRLERHRKGDLLFKDVKPQEEEAWDDTSE